MAQRKVLSRQNEKRAPKRSSFYVNFRHRVAQKQSLTKKEMIHLEPNYTHKTGYQIVIE